MEDQSFKFKYQILNNCVVTSNNEEVANYVNLFISNFLNYEINIDYLMLNSPTNQILCPMLHICRAIIFYFKSMNSLNNPGSSYNDPNVQSSFNYNQTESNSRINRSFVDNKPMIQGLVRSVLKV